MALKGNTHVTGKDNSLNEITFSFFKEKPVLVNTNYKFCVHNML